MDRETRFCRSSGSTQLPARWLVPLLSARPSKKPALGRLFRKHIDARSVAHRPNTGIKPTLVPSGLVLVDDSLVHHAVDGRYSGLVTGLRRLFVASLYRIDDLLDLAADARAKGHIVGPATNRLARSFLS